MRKATASIMTVSEPEIADWGGPWTNQKLNAFVAYVKAYLAIMKNQRGWKTIYFDGFAGSGERILKKDLPEQIDLEFDVSSLEQINVYKGSVSRVLDLSPHSFDYYYFIDTNLTNIEKINQLKKERKHRIIARHDDCNNQLIKLANALKNNTKLAALIFIDPFGMQVNWGSIASLKDTRSDIWILIPSGVIVNRLLTKSGKITNVEKLEKFFGLSIQEIKDIFYYEEKGEGLYGDYHKTLKLNKPIERIVQLYTRQMKSIWKNVSKTPLILKNSKNVPIFHLIFASNNKTAMTIASQIILKKSN